MVGEQLKKYLRLLLIIPLSIAIYLSIMMGSTAGYILGAILAIYSVLFIANNLYGALDKTLEWFQIAVILGFFIYAVTKKNLAFGLIFLAIAARLAYLQYKKLVIIPD